MRYFEDIQVGDELPALDLPALATDDFARYAAASGDHNPLHVSDEHARASGYDGVIAHGMLVMGYLGRVAVALAGPGGLRALRTRFRDKTRPGDALRCGGTVTAAYERDGQGIVEAELWARAADGSLKASGTLSAALPRKNPLTPSRPPHEGPGGEGHPEHQ